MIPSYADFGIAEDSAYPSLWTECIFATAPCLGVTGQRLWDHVTGQVSLAIGWVASRWSMDEALPVVSFVEATNGGFAWPTFTCEPNFISYSIWLKTTQQTANRVAMSVGTTGVNLRLFYNTNNTFTANWFNSGLVQTSGEYPLGWHHIVAQRSRARAITQLWIDGELVVQTTNSTSSGTQSVLCLGARRDSGSQSLPFTGAIDDVSIRHRMLDVDEIRLLAAQRGIGYIRR